MLTPEGCRIRQQLLWAAIPDDVQWALVTDPRHVLYLSNFWVHPLSFSHGERAMLLLERAQGATLIADNFTLRSQAAAPCVDRESVVRWYDHQHSVDNRDHCLFTQVLTEVGNCRGRGVVERQWLPTAVQDRMSACELAPSVDVGVLLRQLRRRKQADEIALLERCMLGGAAGQDRAAQVVRPGCTELEMYREIQSAAADAVGCPVLLYGDFRATNAEVPKAGGLPTNRPLQSGDLLILDFSIVLNGYRSDFTNTLAVGTPTAAQQVLFDTCAQALLAGEQSLPPDVSAAEVYRTTSAVLESAGYDPLPHHAGHGLGLGHPEPPILVPLSEDVLLSGDVVTLEPGSYVAGVGGVRVEHNYLITSQGARRLSNHAIQLSLPG